MKSYRKLDNDEIKRRRLVRLRSQENLAARIEFENSLDSTISRGEMIDIGAGCYQRLPRRYE